MADIGNKRRTDEVDAAAAALRRDVARSVDAPLGLMPWIGSLFADLRALGCHPRTTVRLLSESGLREGSRVIDLGCGMGSVSLELASRLDCRVTGVDGCEAFLRKAEDRARRRGLEARCEFRAMDLRKERPRAVYDAGLLLGVMGVEDGLAIVRGWVRPGGLYVIDDAVRVESASGRKPPQRRGLGPTVADISQLIVNAGDDVLRVWLPTPSQAKAQNRSLYRRIADRAQRLGREAPEIRPLLREFLRRQREANTLLASELRSAVWFVRRGR